MADEKQLEILKNGVKAWNKWRKDNPNVKIDLNRADLNDTDLTGANFYDANLSEVDLSGFDLSGVDLSWANLSGADLRYTNLNGGDLRYTNFNGTNIDGADLTGADLTEADWIKKGLDGNGVYKKERLFDAIHNGFKNLNGANLNGADLTGADLSGANLNGADLTGANLNEAYLTGANLTDVRNIPKWIKKGLDNKGFYDQSILMDAIKYGFKELSGANLYRADLSEINLSKANLSNSNLEKSILTGTNLNQTILFNSNLSDAYISGANLSDADLTNTNLQNSNLREADLNGANLSNANLFGSDLSESNLINTNFSNANITAVNLYGTARDDWVIEGIKCDFFFSDYEKKNQIPENRIYIQSEFEELYKKLPTFEYIFKKGFTPIDAFIVDQVVQAINEQRPEIELKLDSFHSRGQPRAIFTVLNYDYKNEASKQVAIEYEKKLRFLEGRNEILKELVSSCINKPQQFIQGSNITIGENKMGVKGDNIIFSGNGNIVFGKDEATVNQTNIDYAKNNELLAEIKKLKDELSKFSIDQTNREAIDIQFETLDTYAKSDKKNAVLMKSTLESIKTITQGALGSAMGAGLFDAFKRVGLMII